MTLTKPFELGKTEVTQGQWQQVMGTEPWVTEELDKLRKVRADKYGPTRTARQLTFPFLMPWRFARS